MIGCVGSGQQPGAAGEESVVLKNGVIRGH